MAELKNCPFCGGEAKLISINDRWTVKCIKECVGTRIFNDKQRPIDAWNRRTEPDVVRCKDCSRYAPSQRKGYIGGRCGITHRGIYPEDFCSYGEREEDANET